MSIILNKWITALNENTTKLCCNISIPSLSDNVIDNFDLNIFQIKLRFCDFGSFPLTPKIILIISLLYTPSLYR